MQQCENALLAKTAIISRGILGCIPGVDEAHTFYAKIHFVLYTFCTIFGQLKNFKRSNGDQ